MELFETGAPSSSGLSHLRTGNVVGVQVKLDVEVRAPGGGE